MTKNNIKTILFASLIAAILLVPGYGLVNAVQPVELSDELKQKINRIELERQPHMKKIFELAEQKLLTVSESQKQDFNDLIEEELIKLGNTEEKNRKVYNDHLELRSTQNDIRNIDNLPLETTLVGKNKLTIVLQPGNENKGYETIINDSILNDDLSVEITYGSVTLTEWSCNTRDDKCDPLHGGLKIRENGSSSTYCTLGLPVKQGTTSGYLTSGHCYSVNDDVHQPYDHWYKDWKIGKVQTGDSHDDNDCDCAFIEDLNSRTNESKIWLSSAYKSSITGTQVPTDGEELDISGAANGWYTENVYDNDYYHSSIGNRILLEDTGSGGGGDSGAPVFDLSDHDIVGIIEGTVNISGTDYIVVVPWAQIADSTDGLGVSLL